MRKWVKWWAKKMSKNRLALLEIINKRMFKMLKILWIRCINFKNLMHCFMHVAAAIIPSFCMVNVHSDAFLLFRLFFLKVDSYSSTIQWVLVACAHWVCFHPETKKKPSSEFFTQIYVLLFVSLFELLYHSTLLIIWTWSHHSNITMYWCCIITTFHTVKVISLQQFLILIKVTSL